MKNNQKIDFTDGTSILNQILVLIFSVFIFCLSIYTYQNIINTLIYLVILFSFNYFSLKFFEIEYDPNKQKFIIRNLFKKHTFDLNQYILVETVFIYTFRIKFVDKNFLIFCPWLLIFKHLFSTDDNPLDKKIRARLNLK